MCYRLIMRKLLLLFILFSATPFLAASPAAAQMVQQRGLPADGKRAQTGEAHPLPMVELNRQMMRLAPGAIIFDQHNRTIIHAQLPPYADVLYLEDINGNVRRIFVLTPAEQERLDQAPRR